MGSYKASVFAAHRHGMHKWMGGSIAVEYGDDILFEFADVVLKGFFVSSQEVCKTTIRFGSDPFVLGNGL